MKFSLISVLFISVIALPMDSSVEGQFQQSASILQGQTSPYLTQYILRHLLNNNNELRKNANQYRQRQERKQKAQPTLELDPAKLDRKAVEEAIYGENQDIKLIYPETRDKIKHYLDEAKQLTDVIDFHQPAAARIDRSDYVRNPRESFVAQDDELIFSDDILASATSNAKKSSASEQVNVKLEFPGNEYERPKRSQLAKECTNCVDDGSSNSNSRWTMPLQKLGTKQYYLGIFFKANWYKAEQYCRFHGMHLASINSAEEQKDLQDHIQAYGMGHEHFWTSGTDQGEEGKFFWMGTGKPVTYQNWNAGEPNNFQYEDGEQEHCLEMWDRDGKGLGWNDTPCSFSTFFICEA